MGHTGEITRGFRLISSGLRRFMVRATSRGISEGLGIGRALLERLERMGHQPVISDQELADELAKVLAEPGAARLIVRRAGLVAWQIPAFHVPLVFWSTVVEAARNGAIEGGVEALAEAAAAHFPGNEVFARCRASPP